MDDSPVDRRQAGGQMYICSECKQSIGPGIPCHLQTVKTRPKKYPKRRKKDKEDRWITIDQGGTGHEIVKQVKLCLGSKENVDLDKGTKTTRNQRAFGRM
jgi:hypothetical protein